nr:MAG TPA: hypothetical protein [Caudoviricetes sp.]
MGRRDYIICISESYRILEDERSAKRNVTNVLHLRYIR